MVAAALPRILFSDSAILALDKPAGMSTVADPHHAGPALLDLARQIGGEAHLLHRLDRDTSGVVVFARNAAHVAPLVKAFEARAVRKTYHALVAGRPYWSTQLVRAPLRADADREHRTVVDQWRGKDAQTQLDVLERFDACALVQACPLTGRTHQIRVHLTLLGNPIANDSLYARASPQREVTGGLKRLALHAWSIALPHPVTGAVVRIDSPYPADFAEALQELRSRAKPHGRTNPAPG